MPLRGWGFDLQIRQQQRLRLGLLVVTLGGLCVLDPFVPQRSFTLRPPRPATNPARPNPAEGREYTLLFTGDVMLSRAVGERMQAQKDWPFPFRQMEGTLRNADLRYCNLECPVSDRGHNLQHRYSFRADPRAIAGLKAAGFDVVSQANNHAYDWGPAALLDTLRRLRAAGIEPVGAGQNALAAYYPRVVTLSGLRIAFLAYVDIDPKEATATPNSPGVAWLDPAQVFTDIRFARTLADLVIVCPHWGVEYALEPAAEQVQLAHQIIDAGADLIVGSHPHVVQPLEKYHEHWVAYSLGNFIFDQHDAVTHHGLMLKAVVRNKRIMDVGPIPIEINSQFQAMLAPGNKRESRPTLAETRSSPLIGY